MPPVDRKPTLVRTYLGSRVCGEIPASRYRASSTPGWRPAYGDCDKERISMAETARQTTLSIRTSIQGKLPVIKHRSLKDTLKHLRSRSPTGQHLCDLNTFGLIGWQPCSVHPIFLAAGMTHSIQSHADEEPLYFNLPKLPDALMKRALMNVLLHLSSFKRDTYTFTTWKLQTHF
ncbi:hypothetical protein H101_04616 [Trichophyton interdigitale H6]|nr:hypothetical protein H101_04616 [Trichophyton interdigitale H6]